MSYQFLFIVACLVSLGAYAQPAVNYPVRPVRLIVPIAPGGGMDTAVRIFALKLSEVLNQPVIVDNRPGAGGLIGAETTLKAPADGYTLMVGTISTLAMIPATQVKPRYDPLKDFAPISLISKVPYALIAHPSLPVRSIAELVRLAKAKPAYLSYGSAGYATGTHLTAEYFSSVARIKLMHIPYKGAAPAFVDLLAGQVPLLFITAAAAQPYTSTAKARALGVASAKRLPTMPNVPTIAEAGYPGFESESWQGITAPAGTPPAILRKLGGDIVRVMNDPKVADGITSQGNVVVTSTPKEFERFIASEIRKWTQVIASARIRID